MPDGTQDSVTIPAAEFPLGVPYMRLPLPGVLVGRPMHAEFDAAMGWAEPILTKRALYKTRSVVHG